MKKIISLAVLCIMLTSLHAQITAYFSKCAFNTPDNKPYMETYLSVLGNSVSFRKNAQGKFQGIVEVGILFSQNGEIKASKKYNLMSPEQKDTLNRPPFIDQQRFLLDTGSYELELMVSDKNINGKQFSMKEMVQISFPVRQVTISDIELLASFTKAEARGALTKNGYDLVPYSSDFFPENVSEISFYAEVYNTKEVLGENEKFLISYYIESYENKLQLSKHAAFKKETAGNVNILLSKFNIADMPSGNYNLVVEVKNKNNQLVAQKKVFFQRKNLKAPPPPEGGIRVDAVSMLPPSGGGGADIGDLSSISVENTFASTITGKDTLAEFTRSLRPVASQSERGFIDNQLKLSDEKIMQQFFYNFWKSRNKLAPEDAWNKYYQDVKAVNAKFGTFTYKGYETDRGRVYLQYGPPDNRNEYPSEPNSYPYEIWTYNRLTDKSNLNPNQTNKQFIFYTRDLVTNNYQILHSNALSEVHDSRWDMKLHARTVQSLDFEKKDAPEHFGGNASEEFNNPK